MERYIYRATVTSVYDGDTITVDIDLGFGVLYRGQKIRLFGINSPELRQPERAEGLTARDWLRRKILGREIILKTHRDATEKYGRYLGEVVIDGENVNNALVAAGLAEEYLP